MTTDTLAQMQDQIIATLAGAIDKPWSFVALNIEIDVVDGEQTENCLLVSFHKKFWRLVRKSQELPYELYDLFVALRDHMAKANDSSWSSCTLVFDASGRYRFEFSYATPLRLNGVHDDVSMMKGLDPVAFLNRTKS
jgi:hypothetical protein